MSTTTMDAKTAILARARDAISRSQQGRPVRPIPRDYIRSTEHAPGSQAVIDEMIEKLEDYSAKVVVVSKESEVAEPPAIQVIGRVGFLPRMSTAWGTVGTMSAALRTTTWVSGTSEIARRP